MHPAEGVSPQAPTPTLPLTTPTQFFYCFTNAWTGQSLFDGWALAAYNVFFTALPILVVGALDRCPPAHVSLLI